MACHFEFTAGQPSASEALSSGAQAFEDQPVLMPLRALKEPVRAILARRARCRTALLESQQVCL